MGRAQHLNRKKYYPFKKNEKALSRLVVEARKKGQGERPLEELRADYSRRLGARALLVLRLSMQNPEIHATTDPS